MRILVNAMSSVMGGGITVARNLVSSLALEFPAHRILLYCASAAVAEEDYPPNVEVMHRSDLMPRLERWIWEQTRLPSEAVRQRADVVLALGGYASFATTVPQIAVWQNLNVFSPAGFDRPLGERALIQAQRLVQSASMRRARQNVFLTQTSLDLASDVWRMDRIPHCVIHSGVDAGSDGSASPRPMEARERFALAVGHTYTHKNYAMMIDAIDEFRRLYDPPIALRILGGPGSQEEFSSLQNRIEAKGLAELVTIEGEASHRDVLAAMSTARVYIVTSLLETFGLTLLEAMAMGLPVVASDATCHPEIAGDAALLCDPRNPLDIARKLHQIISDDALSSQIVARGYERVQHFSWKRSARRYAEELDRAAAAT
jgi:glycosyltransferase involved in cell wall biosynthesis